MGNHDMMRHTAIAMALLAVIGELKNVARISNEQDQVRETTRALDAFENFLGVMGFKIVESDPEPAPTTNGDAFDTEVPVQ